MPAFENNDHSIITKHRRGGKKEKISKFSVNASEESFMEEDDEELLKNCCE